MGGGTGGGQGPPWRCPRVPHQGESLGQGSFTQIYQGVKRDQDEEDGPRQTPVVLKVMDSSHRNCLEVRGWHCHLRDVTWGGPQGPP